LVKNIGTIKIISKDKKIFEKIVIKENKLILSHQKRVKLN
jgi:hypothetical protein